MKHTIEQQIDAQIKQENLEKYKDHSLEQINELIEHYKNERTYCIRNYKNAEPAERKWHELLANRRYRKETI